MLGFLGSLFGLLGTLIAALRGKRPPAEYRAGAADTKVEAHEAEEKRVAAATDARDAVVNDSLRKSPEQREAADRAPDPYSRD